MSGHWNILEWTIQILAIFAIILKYASVVMSRVRIANAALIAAYSKKKTAILYKRSLEDLYSGSSFVKSSGYPYD